MTVKEFLDDSNALYIKLGAKNGQSFIYCGLAADARDFLESYDEPYIEKLHNNLLRAIHEHAQLINGSFNKVAERLIEQYKEYRRQKRQGGDDFKRNKKLDVFSSLAAYKRHLKKLEQKEIVKAEIRIERYTKRFQNYTPILDRLIVDTYENILQNEDGYIDTIVIYEGDEAGIAWDLTEYRRGGQYEE